MIDPRGMTLQDWTDSMTFELEREDSGTVAPMVGDDWREWGERVIRLLVQNQQHAPAPDQFDDWREWGQRLQLYLGSAS